MTHSISKREGGTWGLGGDLPVHRLGFGAMRITGRGIWGEPRDHDEAIATLRRAVELGINLIDTADSYGPFVSERLIAEALHPYPDDLVIATKGGLTRSGPNRWSPDGRPQHLRAACDGSLQRLRLEQIPLYQLHRVDPAVPIEDSLGMLVRLKDEGKIRHIGVCNVSEDQLDRALRITPIVSVQNRYGHGDRSSEAILDRCERKRWRSFPGLRSAAAASSIRSWSASPPLTMRRTDRSCSPGCWRARPVMCRSPAPARWRTSRRTPPPASSGSRLRRSASSTACEFAHAGRCGPSVGIRRELAEVEPEELGELRSLIVVEQPEQLLFDLLRHGEARSTIRSPGSVR